MLVQYIYLVRFYWNRVCRYRNFYDEKVSIKGGGLGLGLGLVQTDSIDTNHQTRTLHPGSETRQPEYNVTRHSKNSAQRYTIKLLLRVDNHY